MSDVDPTINEVREAVGALQTMVESKAGINKETLEKINITLDAQELKYQETVKDLQASKTTNEEFKERMDALEVELARAGPAGNVNYKEAPEYKALNEMCRAGDIQMDMELKATLRTDNDTAGGYLVTSEMDNVITKKIIEISGIRSLARVRTINSKTLEMAIRNTIPSATFEGEAETGNDSESSYSNESVTAFRQTFTTPVTKDMLMDSSFDMESEIMTDAAEAFAKGEGTGFVVGTGHKQPEGFLVNAAVVTGALTGTGGSGVISADDVINLTGELKVGYDPVYVFNRKTLANLRTKKSTTGAFLWEPGLNGPVANTLNGLPYVIAPDMQDIASNSLSVAFGDFRRGYTIIDRTGMSVIRDELTQKKLAIVEFTFNRWLTGQVTLPEAITLLKTQA